MFKKVFYNLINLNYLIIKQDGGWLVSFVLHYLRNKVCQQNIAAADIMTLVQSLKCPSVVYLQFLTDITFIRLARICISCIYDKYKFVAIKYVRLVSAFSYMMIVLLIEF